MACTNAAYRARIALFFILTAPLALAPIAALAQNCDLGSQTAFGISTYSSAQEELAKNLPIFEVLTSLPKFIDPLQDATIPVRCLIATDKGSKDVKGVKGRYEGSLVILDDDSGEIMSVDLGGGRFKTDRIGRASFEWNIPTDFLDEPFDPSKDSAWAYVRSDFSNKKKVDIVSMSCQTQGAIEKLSTPALAALPAGVQRSLSNFGNNVVRKRPCPASTFTGQDLAVSIGIPDPAEMFVISLFCRIGVENDGDGVNRVKGKQTTEIVVHDNKTGKVESVSVDSSKFKTNKEGQFSFDIDFPSELVPEGFGSGDVSAWSYTQADFSSKRRVDKSTLSCSAGIR